ncbi:MAG: LptF/LptG family permease [Phycisphaerales bacterium]|nr:LptF/LptG family permease [Phycisphaerales bacterium]
MKTIDRYIARQYLLNIIALVIILFSFIIAIDLSLNFDKFMALATKRGMTPEGDPSTARKLLLTIFLVFDYWWPKLVQLFNYMIGLIIIGAMGFTCSQLVRHREFVAAVAGGISLHRLMRPILLVAILVTAVQAISFEYIIPNIADLIQRDREQASQRRLESLPVRLVPDGQRRLFYARSFEPEKKQMLDVLIIERSPAGPATRTISATRALWRDGGWDLENGVAESRSSQSAPREKITRILTDLDPVALKIARFSGYSQSLSWSQISEMLRRPELLALATNDNQPDAARDKERDLEVRDLRVAELERIRYGRVAIMLCNILALLAVTPFFLRREPTSMILESIKAAPLAIGGVMGGVLGASAAIPGLPPQVGVFVPALILLPLAIAAVTSVRT